MSVDIAPVPLAEKPRLATMMQDYVVEMAGILAIPVRPYPYFDQYWTEPNLRWPYWITATGEPAGFALVTRNAGTGVFEIGEYYVAPPFRRRGIGTEAARRVIRSHPGHWRVVQRELNVNAIAFWHHALADYAYEETATVTDVARREQRFTT